MISGLSKYNELKQRIITSEILTPKRELDRYS